MAGETPAYFCDKCYNEYHYDSNSNLLYDNYKVIYIYILFLFNISLNYVVHLKYLNRYFAMLMTEIRALYIIQFLI
jgi:hypothetical protein